ncbi:MAG: hypothetical protein ACRDAX_07410 [Propionibacteriaceae bacterium]
MNDIESSWRSNFVRKVFTVVLAPALLAATLSGCAQSPRDAITVGGHEFTVSDVDKLSEKVAQIDKTPISQARPVVITLLARGELATGIKQAQPDLVVDQSARSEKLATFPAEIRNDAELNKLAESMVDFALLTEKMGDNKTALVSIPVTLNPRYGRWDSERSTVSIMNNSLAASWMQKF